MSDLIHVLPDFDTSNFSHILPSLERALVTSNDLLTLSPLDIAKRAQVPSAEVDKLATCVIAELHLSLHPDHQDEKKLSAIQNAASSISVLDPQLDNVLRGGIHRGQLTEIVGESAAGKTQCLLSLLLAVQLPAPRGLSKSAIYITTEGPLQTSRLTQLLEHNPTLARLDPHHRPSLDRIQSIKVNDLESQDQILRYQVPIVITSQNIGLVVIDSIAANFRAEFNPRSGTSSAALHDRSRKLIQTGAWLRHLARKFNVAVVVANQVTDRFLPATSSSAIQLVSQPVLSQDKPITDSPSLNPDHPDTPGSDTPTKHIRSDLEHRSGLSTNDPLALDHQQNFFSGWGDAASLTFGSGSEYKSPSLGMTWTNQLSARIVLHKRYVVGTPSFVRPDAVGGNHDRVEAEKEGEGRAGGALEVKPESEGAEGGVSASSRWERTFKVAFASWCQDGNGVQGTRFEIYNGGIRCL